MLTSQHIPTAFSCMYMAISEMLGAVTHDFRLLETLCVSFWPRKCGDSLLLEIPREHRLKGGTLRYTIYHSAFSAPEEKKLFCRPPCRVQEQKGTEKKWKPVIYNRHLRNTVRPPDLGHPHLTFFSFQARFTNREARATTEASLLILKYFTKRYVQLLGGLHLTRLCFKSFQQQVCRQPWGEGPAEHLPFQERDLAPHGGVGPEMF